MKKLALLVLVGSLLSVTSAVRAYDDLAVGDPYGNGENPVRVHRKSTSAKRPVQKADEAAGKIQNNDKAAGAQEAPSGDVDEAN